MHVINQWINFPFLHNIPPLRSSPDFSTPAFSVAPTPSLQLALAQCHYKNFHVIFKIQFSSVCRSQQVPPGTARTHSRNPLATPLIVSQKIPESRGCDTENTHYCSNYIYSNNNTIIIAIIARQFIIRRHNPAGVSTRAPNNVQTCFSRWWANERTCRWTAHWLESVKSQPWHA